VKPRVESVGRIGLPRTRDNHTPLGFEKSASLCLPIARAQVTPKVGFAEMRVLGPMGVLGD
jgi:hypothetical protein